MTEPEPAPVHVVPDRPRHGVARFAGEVAGAVGARVLDVRAAAAAPPTRVHVHVTDRLFGDTAADAAATVGALAARHRTTLTLHDLPQPAEGGTFGARSRAYRQMAADAVGVVVSSHHEAVLACEHLGLDAAVVHLPVHAAPRARPRPPDEQHRARSQRAVVGVLGWIYPGKGHAEAVAAARDVPGAPVVRALGAVSPGHDDLLDELGTLAASGGAALETTGWVPDREMPAALGDVDVPVAWHHHVSASGSINSWVAAGRRPLVPAGPYTRELDRLRPGTVTLVEPADVAGLRDAVAAALADPASTWLAEDLDLRPGLPEVAQAYRRWWSRWA